MDKRMKDRAVARLSVVSTAAKSSAKNNPTAVVEENSNSRLGIRTVNAFRCRVWKLHNRLQEGISEESCAELIQSFKAHGQQEPVWARPVYDDREYDLEIFCGARRHFVAKILGIPLLVEVREISAKDAIIAMYVSSLEKPLSPYEEGRGYRQWLESGHFKTQEEMIAVLGISRARLSRLLKVASLPPVIVSAFGSPGGLLEDWGLNIAKLLEDPVRQAPTIRAARTIAAKPSNLRSEQIYQKLLASSVPTAPGHHKVVVPSHVQVIKGEGGVELFRVRRHRDEIALLLPIEKTSAVTLEAIQNAVKEILTASGLEMAATG